MKSSRQFHLRNGRGGAALKIRLEHGSQDEIAGIREDGTVIIQLAGSDEEVMNRSLIGLIARAVEVLPGSIEVVGGITGKDKLVSIISIDAGELQKRLEAYLKRW